jgi:hypothetical protein
MQKNEDGYVLEMDGRAYKVLKAGRESEFIYPTLTKDGELAWTFGWLETDGIEWPEPLLVGIELEDMETGEISDHIISLYTTSYGYRDSLSQELYSISKMNGITVLESRRFYNLPGDTGLRAFSQSGLTLKDEPVLILDIRSHTGGDDGHAGDWVMYYSGQNPSSAMFLSTELFSKTARTSNQYAASANPPKWIESAYASPKLIENANLLIVLMDDKVVSGGEYFVGYLRQLENVVFVGTNTQGCLLTEDPGYIILPASRIGFSFCVVLNIRPDLSQFEGIGFMPDLWVQPGESLERVVKFVDRYKCEASSSLLPGAS